MFPHFELKDAVHSHFGKEQKILDLENLSLHCICSFLDGKHHFNAKGHLRRPLWLTLFASPASYSLATVIIMSINMLMLSPKNTLKSYFKGNVGIFTLTSANVCVDKLYLMSQWKGYCYY